jgi:hypothetical protein
LKITKPITKKRLSSALNEDFITMDIETIGIVKNKVETLSPYLLCWYDGKRNKSHSYFINGGNIKNIIYMAMKDICIRKYKGYKIYLHNFSKFDAIFLIKYLINIGKCYPIIHKGKIISFNFNPNWKKDFGNITFLDSFLLIPSSLKSLSKSFSIDTPKDLFPIFLNDISYKGIVPDIKYFNITTLVEEYNNYKDQFLNKIWNFKDEAIKYCELDCKALYQILSKFNKLIFERFFLIITDFTTLPSLAFNIFRSMYYKNEPERAPSPGEGFISSLVDTGDISSPLQDLLNAQIKISFLLFVSILLAIILLFYKLFSNYSSTPVSMFLTRILPNNSLNSNKGQRFIKFTGQLSHKYFYFIFIILTLNIIFLLFLNFSISYELLDNLDEYIRIHNDIYKNILLGCISSVKYNGLFNRKRSISAPLPGKRGSNIGVGNIINKGKDKLSRKNINKVYEYVQNNEKELDLKIKTSISETFVNLIHEKARDVKFMPGYTLISSFPNVIFINEDDYLNSGMQMPTLGDSSPALCSKPPLSLERWQRQEGRRRRYKFR